MIKAVIFDMDGVLVNTNPIHEEAWSRTLDRYGIQLDHRLYCRCLGMSRRQQLDLILREAGVSFSEEMKQQIMTEKNAEAVGKLSALSREDVDEDVWHTLTQLKKRGISTAVASSSANTRMIINNTSLVEYLDVIVDGSMITRAKPDPEIYDTARRLLRHRRKSCLVVEDAVAGIQAAERAGIRSCGTGEAYGYEKTDYPIGKISDILSVIDQQ